MNLKKALKPIKKNILNRNKDFITIRQVYPQLLDLTNREILDYYNVLSIQPLEQHIKYIEKNLKNQIKEEIKEIRECLCRDSRGEFKDIYNTEKEATQQVEYSFKTKRIKLTTYFCPYHQGWHLKKI